MKKFTLFIIAFFALCLSINAQFSFPPIAGPTNVVSGAPVTLSINDVGNTAAVPASSTGTYMSFSVSVDWVEGGGNPYSSEADLTLTTTAGSISIDPATTGSAGSASPTTMTFDGDFAGLYDPTTDGYLEIVLNQSWSGSDADWSNVVVTIFESPSCPEPTGMMTTNLSTTNADLEWSAGDSESAWNLEWKASADFIPGNGEQDGLSSVSSSPSHGLGGLAPFTTYYVYYQADCSGDLSNWVGPFTFYTGYCDSTPSSNDGDGLANVVLGSSTFNSTGDLTYEDFTATTVDLSESILANLQISFAHTYTYDTNVWIDFNNDLVYDNVTELVFQGESPGGSNPQTLDASFVMPSVPYGVYRMRIGSADFGQATPDPCYTGSWGVTVDLEINVTAPPECIPPIGMMAANSAADTIIFSWTAGDTENDWNIELNADSDFTPGNGEEDTADSVTGTPTYTGMGLAVDTTYYVYYQSDCGAGSTSSWVGPFSYYNGYCDSVPSSNDGDGITQIVLGSSTFTSGGDITYEDFTGTTVDLAELVTANLQITFATGYTYDANVWIDFNNDLVFDNTTELVFFGESTSANPTTLDASFVMPSVPYGVYRMRIGTADSGQNPPDPCFDGSYGVTVDMSINVVAPPSCIPPSFLTVANIGGTAADLSWTANSGETSWEYVVQLAGTGEPVSSGVATSTNTFTESDLDYSTDYELYVMADCGGGDYSTWSGPVNFTTTIQTNYDVVCDTDSPINVTYCYDNNDTTSWVFNSDNGFPFELIFNSGTVEGTFDDLTIYDGIDNTAAVLFNNNDNDQNDLAGLVIETTGTSLYIEVDSDSSVSCQSSSFYTPWDFDVVCKTCLTQSATYTVRGDCEVSQEFFIDVDITDIGTAASLTVSDGTTSQTATTTGLITFGPFPSETPKVITITNADDPSCEISSSTLNLICPPPPNPCSIIYAGEDTSVCENASVNLTASYQILGQDTNTYEINALDSCPQPPPSGGEPTSVEIDDRWSDVIDLGFEFCFFGGTYNQIVIGSNGVLTFDLSNAGGFNAWDIDAGETIPNNTVGALDAHIFGVGHDIDPSVCGDINYYILGASPSRQFVVNYTDVCHFGSSCNALTSSSQIILYESSNAIDINIFDKPTCEDWNEGNAVVGVQNPEGTIGFAPPGRNTGVWEATNEYWRFSPSTGAPNFTIEWFDGDTQIGGSETVMVTPTETTTYTAAITYALCTGETATITDDVVVEILVNPEPIPVQDTIVICEGIEVTLEVQVDNSDIPDTITYYWTYDGVDIQVGPENSYTIPEGTSQFGEFIVTAIDGNGCYGDTIITVIQGAYPVIEPAEALIYKCINEEATLEVFVLNSNELSDSLTYTWYIDGAVAQSGTDSSYIHGIGDEEAVFTVAVSDDVSQCLTETEISVVYYENAYCVDIPQGLSPNNDGYNDCLILDHLEDRHDISKAVVFNRHGTKVFELNDYVDQWCGTNQDGEVLPVGTYFYIIYFNSPREPITSWIYLNY